MNKEKVIEYQGELYESWWDLFHVLEEEGKLPQEISDNAYSLEKYILLYVMKLDAKERPVKSS
jgi:hypothetical protein